VAAALAACAPCPALTMAASSHALALRMLRSIPDATSASVATAARRLRHQAQLQQDAHWAALDVPALVAQPLYARNRLTPLLCCKLAVSVAARIALFSS
jgi:hypothetical protein